MANTNNVLGSILVAHEGVNGTISGPEAGVEALLQSLRESMALGCEQFQRLEVKRSWADQAVFRRFKARRKKEIVTMGVTSVNPRESVGTYVDPKDWNALVDDPDTLVIDTRNSYETAIGSFEGSLDPGTESFRDFPEWAEARLRPLVNDQPPKRIAMFCTGGIRCEKASSYLQQQGFGEVHHLRGGILKYLEQSAGSRRAAGRGSALSSISGWHSTINWNPECTASAMPAVFRFQPNNRAELPSYIKGVQCIHCMDRFSDADRARFAMRQQQFDQMSS